MIKTKYNKKNDKIKEKNNDLTELDFQHALNRLHWEIKEMDLQ